MKKLNINDLLDHPAAIEVNQNTPGADITTVYIGIANPHRGGNSNLRNLAIKRIVIDGSVVGKQTILQTWAVTDSAKINQLEYGKDWDDRASLDYRVLTF